MKRQYFITIITGLALLAGTILNGCSGKGSSGSVGGAAGSVSSGTTVLAGKVTLSSTVQLKTSTRRKMDAGENFTFGKPGSKSYIAGLKPVVGTSLKQSVFGGVLDATQLTNATVDLYDASHPEWLYPVASTKTDSNGDYTLNKLINADYNKGATYSNDNPIPTGLYTMVAYKVGVGLKPVVSVQSVVNRFDGFQSVDFEVVDSDIEPSVQTMFGVFKNTDGTETWGNAGLVRALNGAIQISFSMPMWRDSLTGISISPSVEGNWSLSADWRTATFYPKSGVTLQPNTVYTVKVNGSETSNPVYNVYTNPIRTSAYGYFVTGPSADYQGPTAQWKSPSLYAMKDPIDIASPIRIQVNKPLDVNGLYLDAQPSVGDRTSVYFLGTETDSNGNLLYIYEFGLGKSLKLNTQYTMTVMGGKDLAGNPLTTLTASISTMAAQDYAYKNLGGIDPNADQMTQDLQAEIYDVFGKWARSMNDHNMALFQSLMTGDFYMEYNTVNGLSSDDTNHDGRYSLNEFTRMLLTNAFPQWAYCGAEITGVITPGTYITIGVLDPTTGQLDMSMATLEFKLMSTTSVQSQQCSETTPSDKFYLTLKKYNDNSPWVVRRASEGLDNRNVIPSQPNMLKANLYALSAGKETLIADGGQLQTKPMPAYAAEFKWDPVPGVQSLVLAVIDSRTNCTGFAAAYPSSVTGVTINNNPTTTSGLNGWTIDMTALAANTGNSAVDVTSLFGLDGTRCNNSNMMMGMAPPPNFFQDGGQYYWEIIGFKSTDTSSITGSSSQTLINDIGSISTLKRFNIAGLYRELALYVNALGKDLTYDGVIQGYDAGGAGQVTLTIYSPNTNGTGNLYLSGTASQNYTLPFDSSGKATSLIDRNGNHLTQLNLYRGVNFIWMDDGNGLFKAASIFTTGGIAPAINFIQVTDDVQAPLGSLDGGKWDFFQTNPGAKTITIQAQFNPPGACSPQSTLQYNVYNGKLKAQRYGTVTADVNGDYFFNNLEIYQGVNWINISGNDTCGNYYQRQIGVSTDTGSPWIPLIMVSSVVQAVQTADYGQMSDWDASADLDNQVQINLKFKLCDDGAGNMIPPNVNWNDWSDGGNQWGNFIADAQGNGSIWIPIYHGMNNVNINTWYSSGSCQGGWYTARINTTAGIPVVNTAITSINGLPYTNGSYGSYTVPGCTATITGTAEPGQVSVYWRGYNGSNYYYENNRTVVSDPATNTFTVTVPVLSGNGAYNMVDIYNRNWVSTSVTLYTTGNCSSYTVPVLNVNTINWTSGSTVTVSGTSNKPGQSITAYQNTCSNSYDFYSTTASTTMVAGSYPWSMSNVKVYNGWNNFYFSDGYNSSYASVSTTNGIYMVPGTKITSITGTRADTSTFGISVPPLTSNCGSMLINTQDAVTVKIDGTTDEPNSRGYYSIGNGMMMMGGVAPVYFSSGGFSISNVPVYSIPSPDNTLMIANAYGNQVLNADLQSSNGIPMPKYVEITSPIQGGTVPSGPFTVTADIKDPSGTGWQPTYYQAIMFDQTNGTQYFYSSDPNEQAMYGYLPFNSVVTTGLPAGVVARVSYDVDGSAISPTDVVELGVAGIDWGTMQIHVDIIWVNNTSGNTEQYYKPGAKTSGTKASSTNMTPNFLIRQMLKHKAEEIRN